MRGKYFVIAGLLLVVGALVYVMARLQQKYLTPEVKEVELMVPEEIDVVMPYGKLRERVREAEICFRVNPVQFQMKVTRRNRRGEESQNWEDVFIKGVNLGAALPGRYPSEFTAAREDYARWLRQMCEAGFNAVRVYTILPPEFYQALARHNFDYSRRPIYLFQGIWSPLPEDGNYFAEGFVRERKREIRRAVDLIHGRAIIRPRPGHASGTYNADVSGFTIGFLFGREWEPHSVMTNDSLHQGLDSYDGDFFSVPQGSPTEVWLAQMLDFLVRYETAEHQSQRPVSFVNWLPLDPMHHPTEFIEGEHIREYDNDLVEVDVVHIHTTPLNRAGFFAAYHAYPYYPDFVSQQQEYVDCESRFGKDNYAGYLRHLKAYHHGMALLIAEFGVPSSRGNSHYSPFGWSQGGHTEEEQAGWNIRQFQDIYDEGCAGGLVFAWLDEWFKHNWLVQDFEKPKERNRFWHNVQDPEQCYGLVKFGPEKVTVDGDPSEWDGAPVLKGSGRLRGLWLDADPGYLYCRIDLAEPIEWDSAGLVIAIDSYDPKSGALRLGFLEADATHGVEFLVHFADTGRAEVLVSKPYEVFSNPYWEYRPEYRTRPDSTGLFVSERLLSNRQRVSPDGRVFAEHVTGFGQLRYGRSDSVSLADWFVNDSVLELRLPWGCLNVTDPSSHMVLQDDPDTPGLDIVETDGFSVAVLEYRKQGLRIVEALPGMKNGKVRFSRRWRWTGWEIPEYRERLKKGYRLMAEALPRLEHDRSRRSRALARVGIPADTFAVQLSRFRHGAKGAVSITLDDGSFEQSTIGLRALERYGFAANFGLVSGWTDPEPAEHAEQGGLKTRRLGVVEAKALVQAGHSISAHSITHRPDLYELPRDSILEEFLGSRRDLMRKTGASVNTLHYPYSKVNDSVVQAVVDAGFWFARVTGDRYNPVEGFDRRRVMAFASYNDTIPSLGQFRRILENGQRQWIVLEYHHLFPDKSKEMQVLRLHKVVHTYRVSPATFERHLRMIRNSGFWVAPIEDVGRYLLQRQGAGLDVRRFEGSALVKVNARPGPGMEPVLLTISAVVPWKWVRVTGSEQDGVYSPRSGRLLIDALPGAEVLFDGLGKD